MSNPSNPCSIDITLIDITLIDITLIDITLIDITPIDITPIDITPTKHPAYRKNPIATPPSTLIPFPVDLFSNPPTNAKQALAMSSGRMISLSRVRLA